MSGKSGLLSEEEIRRAYSARCDRSIMGGYKNIANAQLAKCEPLIRAECEAQYRGMCIDPNHADLKRARADEREKCEKEKAEFGLSVHEAAMAMTLKEVVELLEAILDNYCFGVRISEDRKVLDLRELIEALKKGEEMP